jgi:hypothetical protein
MERRVTYPTAVEQIFDAILTRLEDGDNPVYLANYRLFSEPDLEMLPMAVNNSLDLAARDLEALGLLTYATGAPPGVQVTPEGVKVGKGRLRAAVLPTVRHVTRSLSEEDGRLLIEICQAFDDAIQSATAAIPMRLLIQIVLGETDEFRQTDLIQERTSRLERLGLIVEVFSGAGADGTPWDSFVRPRYQAFLIIP